MLFYSLVSLIAVAAATEPIGVYDLTYTLHFDASNRAEVEAAWDHCHAAATLQGIVNREEPRLYLRYVKNHGINIDDYWLEKCSRSGEWMAGRARKSLPDMLSLIEAYRHDIHGAVVYDPNVPATSNLASTIAGVEDLIAIRYDKSANSLYSKLILRGPKLPVVKWLLKEDGTSLFTGSGTIPGTHVPSTGSAKCDAYIWLKHHYLDRGKVNANFAGFYIDAFWQTNPTASNPNHHTLSNHDFFVSKKGFFFDLGVWKNEKPVDDPNQPLGTDLNTLKALLLSAYQQGGREEMIHIGGFTPWAFKYTNHGKAGGQHGGVPTEWEFSRIVSAYNGFVDADAIGLGAMANASFWRHYPLKKHYPQPWVSKKELQKRGYLTKDDKVKVTGRDFIVFYVGDYDSAAWLYQMMPRFWEDENRGKVPMMWSISPVLARRAGMAMHYLRQTATKNDYFAAADNGGGYLNPGMLQEPRPVSALPSGLDAWAKHCLPFYKQWGISITGFVIDGYAPGLNEKGLDCYARFSPNGIVPQKIPPFMLHENMPVMRADHDVNESDPAAAVNHIIDRLNKRDQPFHWFRNILKSPSWYAKVVEKLEKKHPRAELLDAPTFFRLLRIYLNNHPKVDNKLK